MLSDYFLQKFNAETGRKLKGFTPAAKEQLQKYLSAGKRPRTEERDRAGGRALPRPGDRRRRPVVDQAGHRRRHRSAHYGPGKFQPISLDDVEGRHIFDTLNHTGWNKSKTAGILGIEAARRSTAKSAATNWTKPARHSREEKGAEFSQPGRTSQSTSRRGSDRSKS